MPGNRRVFSLSAAWAGSVFVVAMLNAARLAAQPPDGALETIRDDVRLGPPAAAAPHAPQQPAPRETIGEDPQKDAEEKVSEYLVGRAMIFGAAAATVPYWLPNRLLDDHTCDSLGFAPHPYEDGSRGRMEFGADRWGGSVRFDYGNAFDDPARVAGGVLIEHARRFGLDMQGGWYEERLGDHRWDRLWIGDANLVFRFAQSERMQFRSGVGVNWLNDDRQTDVGFNFTYGMDWFPARPWVFSCELDGGWIGQAGLFRARTTGGMIWRGVETFTGYEYLDIGRTQSNLFLAGIRFWY